MDRIKQLRNEIDQVDDQIMKLLEKRFDLVKLIGYQKKRLNIEVMDNNREQLILEKISKYSHFPLIEHVYKEIFTQSKNTQRKV